MTTTVPAEAAAYVRVARADSPQDPVIERQQAAVLRAAAALGWPVPVLYTDTGRTGWNRPGSALDTLTVDIAAGRRDGVITADIARISRTASHVTAFAELCASHGVALHTLTDGSTGPATAAFTTSIS
jgi:DNA invertase Pin-like site-specific DNA recombinase